MPGGTTGTDAQLAAFYRDVVLVLQNAMAFNEESTAIAQAATKLQVGEWAGETD